MINIKVSEEKLKKPEVYQAMMQLLEVMNDHETHDFMPTPPRKRKANARHSSEQVGSLNIDPEVREAFQEYVSKAKSLFFLSIIKRAQVADSDAIVREMEKHYPKFTRKSIGGITGAIRRWFDQKGITLPYQAEPDRSRNGIHIFTWTQKTASKKKVNTSKLKSKIDAKFHVQFQKLVGQGSIGKKDFKRPTDYNQFVKEIFALQTDLFENNGDSLVYMN